MNQRRKDALKVYRDSEVGLLIPFACKLYWLTFVYRKWEVPACQWVPARDYVVSSWSSCDTLLTVFNALRVMHDVDGPCMSVNCGGLLPLALKLASGGNSPGHYYIHVSDLKCQLHSHSWQTKVHSYNVVHRVQLPFYVPEVGLPSYPPSLSHPLHCLQLLQMVLQLRHHDLGLLTAQSWDVNAVPVGAQ